MIDKKILIGSLSNDLYRIVNLKGRGPQKAADRFWLESKKWSSKLINYSFKKYIKNIILDLNSDKDKNISQEKAEKLLMYSVLLQNYSININ